MPTDATGSILVHYTPSYPQRYIPVWRILEPDFKPDDIEGRIVFIGTSAAGLKDLRATPFAADTPGVEVHAQLVEQIVSGRYLERPDFAPAVELAFVLVIGAGLILLLTRIGAVWAGALGAGAVALACGVSWLAFTRFGWMVDPVSPSIAAMLVFLTGTVIVYLQSEYQRQQVRGAFSRYMSPHLVERLAEHPEQLVLGGETRDMTIMFCDIRGFTSISEQFDAQGLTSMLNRFLTPMTELILDREGTIDKYMGDAIMAFWNAPLDDPDHAEHACLTGLAMIARLKELNVEWRAAAEAEGKALFPDQHRRRPQHRLVLGRQYGLRPALRLFGDRRRREPRLAPRGPVQDLWRRHRRRREHARARARASPRSSSTVCASRARAGRCASTASWATRAWRRRPSSRRSPPATTPCSRLTAPRTGTRAERLAGECRAKAEGRLDHLYDLYRRAHRRLPARAAAAGWDGVTVALTK